MELAGRLLKWRLRNQDAGACRELIRHHPLVFGHLMRLGADASLAEDLTQETYARAWSKLDTLRDASSLRAWLLKIARNEFFQHVRSRTPQSTALDCLPEPEEGCPSPDRLLTTGERNHRLKQAVDRLDSTLRETVALHYFQDLSLREVAEALSVPVGTVKSRINRALGSLREMLGKEE